MSLSKEKWVSVMSEQILNQSNKVKWENKSRKTKHLGKGSAGRETWENGTFNPPRCCSNLGDRSRSSTRNSTRPALATWSLTQKQHPTPQPHSKKTNSKTNKTLSIWRAQQVLEESAGWEKQALQCWSTGQSTGKETTQTAPAHFTVAYVISAIGPSHSNSKILTPPTAFFLCCSLLAQGTPVTSKRVFFYLFFIFLKSTFLHSSNLSENLCSWISSKFF